eukprot:1378621-Pleurochrysis_carterae.AAC.2
MSLIPNRPVGLFRIKRLFGICHAVVADLLTDVRKRQLVLRIKVSRAANPYEQPRPCHAFAKKTIGKGRKQQERAWCEDGGACVSCLHRLGRRAHAAAAAHQPDRTRRDRLQDIGNSSDCMEMCISHVSVSVALAGASVCVRVCVRSSDSVRVLVSERAQVRVRVRSRWYLMGKACKRAHGRLFCVRERAHVCAGVTGVRLRAAPDVWVHMRAGRAGKCEFVRLHGAGTEVRVHRGPDALPLGVRVVA